MLVWQTSHSFHFSWKIVLFFPDHANRWKPLPRVLLIVPTGESPSFFLILPTGESPPLPSPVLLIVPTGESPCFFLIMPTGESLSPPRLPPALLIVPTGESPCFFLIMPAGESLPPPLFFWLCQQVKAPIFFWLCQQVKAPGFFLIVPKGESPWVFFFWSCQQVKAPVFFWLCQQVKAPVFLIVPTDQRDRANRWKPCSSDCANRWKPLFFWLWKQVKARDRGTGSNTGTATVYVDILDINNKNPYFDPPSVSVTVLESKSFCIVTCTDGEIILDSSRVKYFNLEILLFQGKALVSVIYNKPGDTTYFRWRCLFWILASNLHFHHFF